MNGMILSHIPIHEQQLARFKKNIHGHLHSNHVMKDNGYGGKIIDSRYFNVSVEQIDFAPILFEDALKKIKIRDEELGFIDDRVSILGPD